MSLKEKLAGLVTLLSPDPSAASHTPEYKLCQSQTDWSHYTVDLKPEYFYHCND